MKRIVVIHTVKSTLETIPGELKKRISQPVEVLNIYDDAFAQVDSSLKEDELRSLRMSRLDLLFQSAEMLHPDVILVACSTLSLEAYYLKDKYHTPIVTVDSAMIENAVKDNRKVALFATSPNPVPSVMTRLREAAEGQGKTIDIDLLLCEEALPYLLANDKEALRETVMSFLKKKHPDYPIVLAQYSSALFKEDIEVLTGQKVYSAQDYLYADVNRLLLKENRDAAV